MIAIASDHLGVEYKKLIKDYLIEKGYKVKDLGCDLLEKADYPVYAEKTVKAIISGECKFGIIICGTGVGMSIAANRFKGIRCALCSDSYVAKMSRLHNNANVLALGAKTTGINLVYDIVDTWLCTSFEGDRHQRRIDMLDVT